MLYKLCNKIARNITYPLKFDEMFIVLCMGFDAHLGWTSTHVGTVKSTPLLKKIPNNMLQNIIIWEGRGLTKLGVQSSIFWA